MNVLGHEYSDANGLSFALLIDRRPLADLIGGMDRALPYYLVGDDLPVPSDVVVLDWIAATPCYRGRESEVRLVAVCDCGEMGCGCTVCRVVHDGDAVCLRDFLGSGTPAVVEREFRFSRENYEAVVTEMKERARAHRAAV